MFLIVNAVHASFVTALIVNQDEALGTFSANISEDIVLTSENVDIALTFIEMIEVSALKARGFVS